jgi:acetyltransferase-like isoleucine patch superfamily enzyme
MKDSINKETEIPKEIRLLNKLTFLFVWTKIFYPRFRGLKPYYLFFYFFPQKVIGINRFVPWPVHFTSKVLYHKNITVGVNSAPGLSNGCYIQGRNGIIIGNNVRVGPSTGIISANHDPNDYDKWLVSSPIRIGDNVWIGMNVVIMPGVSIGSNVLVGANSVVTRDIPDNTIAFGSPCKVIKEKSSYIGKEWS